MHGDEARTVGIGLIGTGFMGGIHARAYRSVPWIFPDAAARPDVRAVADVRLEDARAFARRFGIPDWTDDWRALLGRADVELVDVCTPPALHLRIATEAAAAGKHVYCEKPVGRALAEFAGGATGILDASRVATGSGGELTFDIVGSRGAVRWDLRRMNELRVCVADGPGAEQGFTTIQTGPANRPYGRFIPSPLGLGYADTKVIEAYRVVDALAKGEAVSPSIGDVLAVARLIDAVERGGWVEIAG